MSSKTFLIDNLEILLTLNIDNCYIEILHNVSCNKYALIIDKMILDDIKVIPNYNQMFKILNSVFNKNDDLSHNIKINPNSIELFIKMNNIIEISFNLLIPKINSNDNIEIFKLQKKIIELENIIHNINKQLTNILNQNINYSIPEYINMVSNKQPLIISKIYKKIKLLYGYDIPDSFITNPNDYVIIKNYRHIDKILHNLDEFIIENIDDPECKLPNVKINIKKLIIKSNNKICERKKIINIGHQIDMYNFFDDNIEIEEIEIYNDSIRNISMYFEKIRGLKKVKIVNSPDLISLDVGLKKEYDFGIVYE